MRYFAIIVEKNDSLEQKVILKKVCLFKNIYGLFTMSQGLWDRNSDSERSQYGAEHTYWTGYVSYVFASVHVWWRRVGGMGREWL